MQQVQFDFQFKIMEVDHVVPRRVREGKTTWKICICCVRTAIGSRGIGIWLT